MMGRVLNGGVDVLTLKEGVVSQNLIMARSIGQKFENVSDTDALAANAGTAPHLPSSTVILLSLSALVLKS